MAARASLFEASLSSRVVPRKSRVRTSSCCPSLSATSPSLPSSAAPASASAPSRFSASSSFALFPCSQRCFSNVSGPSSSSFFPSLFIPHLSASSVCSTDLPFSPAALPASRRPSSCSAALPPQCASLASPSSRLSPYLLSSRAPAVSAPSFSSSPASWSPFPFPSSPLVSLFLRRTSEAPRSAGGPLFRHEGVRNLPFSLAQVRGYKPVIDWVKTRIGARIRQYRKRSLKKKNHSKVIMRFKLTRFGWQRLRSGRNGEKENLTHKQLKRTMGYTYVSRDDLWKFRFQLPSHVLRIRDAPINRNPNIRKIRRSLPSYFG
ncbi:hypothetical protein BESB_043890 [Besnoitia besnoiti]|uniref:Uncharacterized protein n=1 Tax=Besnoitia besnoiti TaxID=94643 RepID=A0A2A9MKP7_BESBE|nr:hypothetical protein BESB_043890 [Besnoitia besnoiti]PFH36197.1 hypothetical protein BESB_043890 [Besnoitia besnoiti]